MVTEQMLPHPPAAASLGVHVSSAHRPAATDPVYGR